MTGLSPRLRWEPVRRPGGVGSTGSTVRRDPPFPLTGQVCSGSPGGAGEEVAEHRRLPSAPAEQGAPYPPGAREAGRGTDTNAPPPQPHRCRHLSVPRGRGGRARDSAPAPEPGPAPAPRREAVRSPGVPAVAGRGEVRRSRGRGCSTESGHRQLQGLGPIGCPRPTGTSPGPCHRTGTSNSGGERHIVLRWTSLRWVFL